MAVDKNFKNFVKCICFKCPSHNICMKLRLQKVFCATGNSGCEVENEGCICAKCPVQKEYGLKELYYCKEKKGDNG